MRSRLVLALLAVGLAVVAVIAVIARLAGRPSVPQSAHATLPANPRSYLGVYEKNALTSYQDITQFGDAASRQPNLAGYYSGWGEPFKVAFARQAYRHGAATLIQIDPTYAPVAAIAVGDYDDYLRSFADAVRDFGHPVVIGFGHEMNATWYTWGYGHVPPRTFVAAWRHVVTLFRQQGADNVTWLWTIQADIKGSGPIKEWWPGSQYVTWVGIDGYYFRSSATFSTVFGATIAQLRSFTTRPVLISETAVGPFASQPAKIENLFQGMATYQTLGLVWFDITQQGGIYHQDWRIEGSPAAEAAFRLGVRTYLTG